MRVDLTIAQIGALKAMLGDELADDEQGWLDAIEGETDAFEMIRRFLSRIEEEEGARAVLTEQMDSRKVRRDRCDTRIERGRLMIATLMKCAGIDKLPLPEATLTLRETAAKLAINDPAAVPREYQVATWKPSMDAIKAAFPLDGSPLPNWVRIEDPRPALTIRRK